MFQEYLVSSKTAGSGSPWPPLSKFCPFPCACKSLKVFFSNPVVFYSLLVRYCLPIIVFSLNYPGGEAIKTLHSLKVKFHDILCLQNKSLLMFYRLQPPLSMCTWMYLPAKLGCHGFFKKGDISQLLRKQWVHHQTRLELLQSRESHRWGVVRLLPPSSWGLPSLHTSVTVIRTMKFWYSQTEYPGDFQLNILQW